jgi:hypothetical protein
MIKIKGIYINEGRIELENKKIINLKNLTDEKPTEIPFGSTIEISIAFYENDFLSGKDGIVWATYDKRQAEIIQNTLLAQNISSELKRINLGSREMLLLNITNDSDIIDAIDFIWRSKTGLRLKPDWTYPEGEKNKSFEQWLSGH